MLRILGFILLLLGWLPVCAVGSTACHDWDAPSELSVASALENLTDFADLEEVACPSRSPLELTRSVADVASPILITEISEALPLLCLKPVSSSSSPLLQLNNWQFLLRTASAPRAPSLV